jgi:hypothetical protein
MVTIQTSRNVLQKATCLLLSLVIVGTGISVGALVADQAAQRLQYSVTVTQLS